MASLAQRTQQQQPQPTSNQSQTITTAAPTAEQTQTRTQPVLRLRGAHNPTGRTVRWRSDVVDNEGLGRKKSKVCCIYHRPRGVDESSDESSSSSDSDSDSDCDGRAGDADRAGKDGHGHGCNGHSHGRGRPDGASGRRRRQPSPNAYEKMPRYDKPRKSDGPGGTGKEQGQEGPQGRQAGAP
ncbi:hypothetical protein VTK26DRAFT_4812 [Humicola hyalothermophila]